jgi:hypothetical protein
VCPRCGRTFTREHQFHSHDTEDLDAHLAGRPARLRESFDKLIESLPSDVGVEALRSVVVLTKGHDVRIHHGSGEATSGRRVS